MVKTMGEVSVPRLLDGEQLVILPVMPHAPVYQPCAATGGNAQPPTDRAARGAFAGALKE